MVRIVTINNVGMVDHDGGGGDGYGYSGGVCYGHGLVVDSTTGYGSPLNASSTTFTSVKLILKSRMLGSTSERALRGANLLLLNMSSTDVMSVTRVTLPSDGRQIPSEVQGSPIRSPIWNW